MQQNHIVNKENLILVDHTLKLEDLRKIDLSDSQIITFDFISHKLLSGNKISHQTSETYVDKNEYVDADKVVASTKIPGNVQMLNIAKRVI